MGFVGELMDNKGIEGYYIIGFIIFVVLFVFMLVRTIKIPKNTLIEYKTAILDDDDESINGLKKEKVEQI